MGRNKDSLPYGFERASERVPVAVSVSMDIGGSHWKFARKLTQSQSNGLLSCRVVRCGLSERIVCGGGGRIEALAGQIVILAETNCGEEAQRLGFIRKS